MALWEFVAPRRHQAVGRRKRWPGNIGIVAIDTLAVRVLFPTAAVGVALAGEAHGWGLLNMTALPTWLEVAAAVLILDLAIYFQPVLFHAVPLLWRLHRMRSEEHTSELQSLMRTSYAVFCLKK